MTESLDATATRLASEHRPSGRFDDGRTIEAVLSAKRLGGSDKAAAECARISRPTLYAWLKRGEQGEAGYVEFRAAFIEAERFAENAKLDALRKQIALSTDPPTMPMPPFGSPA